MRPKAKKIGCVQKRLKWSLTCKDQWGQRENCCCLLLSSHFLLPAGPWVSHTWWTLQTEQKSEGVSGFTLPMPPQADLHKKHGSIVKPTLTQKPQGWHQCLQQKVTFKDLSVLILLLKPAVDEFFFSADWVLCSKGFYLSHSTTYSCLSCFSAAQQCLSVLQGSEASIQKCSLQTCHLFQVYWCTWKQTKNKNNCF